MAKEKKVPHGQTLGGMNSEEKEIEEYKKRFETPAEWVDLSQFAEELRTHAKDAKVVAVCVNEEQVAVARCPNCGYYVHTMNDDVVAVLKRIKFGGVTDFVCDCPWNFIVIKTKIGYIVLHR